MKKKYIFALALIAMMAAASGADAQSIFGKSAEKKAEAAKTKYQTLTSNCQTCAAEVEQDSVYGDKYRKLKKNETFLNDSLPKLKGKYFDAIKILNEEIERVPYNNAEERKGYKKYKKKIESQHKGELDALYLELEKIYKQLVKDQKTYWNSIVERKVEKSIKK
jgi:hypothetical protein